MTAYLAALICLATYAVALPASLGVAALINRRRS